MIFKQVEDLASQCGVFLAHLSLNPGEVRVVFTAPSFTRMEGNAYHVQLVDVAERGQISFSCALLNPILVKYS